MMTHRNVEPGRRGCPARYLRRTVFPVRAVTLFAVLLWMCNQAQGHGVLSDLIEHHVKIVAGKAHIDVELDLTFHGDQALGERRRMDGDRDGRVSQSETAEYLAKLSGLEKGIRLLLDDHQLEVLLLYDPELSLLDNDRVSSHPFTLRLFYFARFSRRLRSVGSIEFTDGLWSKAPTFLSLEVGGREGVHLTSRSSRSPFGEARMGRVFRIRYALEEEVR